MAHTQPTIDGVSVPSVTQIVGVLDKSAFLTPWAGKLGTLKAQALAQYVIGDTAGEDQGVSSIPDSWFNKYSLDRANFWKNHEQMGQEAQDKGVQFHYSVEQALKRKFRMPYEPFVAVSFTDAIELWADRVKFIPTAFEQAVICKEHLYGGKFDCLGTVDREATIVDWKRTNSISRSYVLQLAGYTKALLEQTGQAVYNGRIVRPYELKKPAKKTATVLTRTGLKHSFEGSTIFIEEIIYTNVSFYLKPFLAARDLYDFIHKQGAYAAA